MFLDIAMYKVIQFRDEGLAPLFYVMVGAYFEQRWITIPIKVVIMLKHASKRAEMEKGSVGIHDMDRIERCSEETRRRPRRKATQLTWKDGSAMNMGY